MKYKRLKFVLLLLVSSTILKAQSKLSLSDAVQLGLERNYDIRIEKKNVDIATNNNNWGEAGRYPTISLDINQNNSLTDNIKTASPFALQDKTISNSLSPQLSLNWNLFNGLKISMSKYRLEELQNQSSGNADIVIANTIQSVILGYYKAVLEKRRLDEFGKQLQLSGDKLNYTRVKMDLGSTGRSDYLLQEGNYLTDSTNFINQELTYRNAIRDLNVLLGEVEVDKEHKLTDDLIFDEEKYELEDLLTKLTSRNVDLKKQYLAQSIVNYDLGISRSSRYPSLSFSSGFSHSRSRVDLSNASFVDQSDGSTRPGPQDPLNAVTNNYFGNFKLSFTLFNGGKINRAIQNAIIREDMENIKTDELKTSLYRDIARVHDQYEIRKKIYSINLRKSEAASTNLEISEEKFKTGSINSFDFRTVQNNNLSAAIQELQSLYNLLDSKVALMRLTGGIIETYTN